MIFRWTARILFIDTDASGRIHYTSMFRYFESAELEFFRSVGVLQKGHGTGFPRVHAECDYSGAIVFDDELVFEVTVGRIGRSSLQLKFLVLKEEAEVARGNVVIVSMDQKTQRASAIPESAREKLQPYLNP
jgi:YbgC/YbaW family acyl-CoA thioester hydrolase